MKSCWILRGRLFVVGLLTCILLALVYVLTRQYEPELYYPQSRSELESQGVLNDLWFDRDLKQDVSYKAAPYKAARYITRYCHKNGMFNYIQSLELKDGKATTNIPYAVGWRQMSYSDTRHCGTIYALVSFALHVKNVDDVAYHNEIEASLNTAKRAAGYITNNLLKPLTNSKDPHASMMAVWSYDDAERAKLGSNSLCLLAFAMVEQAVPGTIPFEHLHAVAEFIIFMQEPNGRFWTSYYNGKTDKPKPVLYYPGEAMLALLMLYQLDPQQQYIDAVTKGLLYLEEQRKKLSSKEMIIDHWVLIAIKEWNKVAGGTADTRTKNAVMHQAERIVNATLCSFPVKEFHSACSLATRMEALQAALTYLPAFTSQGCTPYLANAVMEVKRHMERLMDSQVVEDDSPMDGAIPKYLNSLSVGKSKNERHVRLSDVRIDYVQHTLSAMVKYWQGEDNWQRKCLKTPAADKTFVTEFKKWCST